MISLRNTKAFLDLLKKEKELVEIEDEIDPHLDLAEIQRRAVAKKGPALLFQKVKGTAFPVATNLYGSQKRIDLAFGQRPERLIKRLVEFAETFFPPKFKKMWDVKDLGLQLLRVGQKTVKEAPVLAYQIPSGNLKQLPQIQCWPEDGGPFLTLPLVYTENPHTRKSNLGMYRNQIHDENFCGMHFQIHRGGGFHYFEAEKRNESLPVHIYLGGPPALTIAAISPLPEDLTEILFASLLMGEKIPFVQKKEISTLPILADADFCLVGDILPHKRKPEGPFGDHYGYYSLQHDYPYVKIRNVFHRKGAIFPATVVGRPPQEDHYIACYLQDILKPLIHMVMPQVRQIWAFEESGVHALAGAIVKDRYPKEALITALRILGEGQLSLSKVLMVTDVDCDVKNFREFLPKILERINFHSDLHVFSHIPQDTLDYTTKTINMGSKVIFLGIGEQKRGLPKNFSGDFSNNHFTDPTVFCPGALVVSGSGFQENDLLATQLANENAIKDWPIVFLVDDAIAATKTSEDFVWHIFTRFEPAADIYAKNIDAKRFHFSLTPPVVIDCRMKPWYPKVLKPDPQTLKNVEPILAKYRLE